MKWSNSLIQTLRDNPSDAEIASHKLMIRASLIRKLTNGIFSYLPLGWLSIHKTMNIVREEMLKIGAVECLLPVLQPIDLWIKSNRERDFGSMLCKFKDRGGHINVLGPTHEEVITNLVGNELSSYRQLPITLFQIQVKFRDELRPRFGILRSREFITKDAYSFDVDQEGLDKSYKAQSEAYFRIFNRVGLGCKQVDADVGLIGGSESHEFMVRCKDGQDMIAECPKCGYCANAEKAECISPKGLFSNQKHFLKQVQKIDTPNVKSVEDLASFLNVQITSIVKTLILRSSDGKYIAALLRGDHELNMTKLARTIKMTGLELAEPNEIENVTSGPFGFSGPKGLSIPIICDLTMENMANFITGSNQQDCHLINVNIYKDFTPTMFADIRVAAEGDLCTRCMAKLEFSKAIEIAHIFKLGTKYSETMDANFINAKGEQKPFMMGCYGIGINRIVAAAIETNHDANGIIWPKTIAPYQVEVLTINPKDDAIQRNGDLIYGKLKENGIDVIIDDRDQTAGVKFADSDLIGFPVRVVVGSKTISENTVDIKLRTSKDQSTIKVDSIVEAVARALDLYKI